MAGGAEGGGQASRIRRNPGPVTLQHLRCVNQEQGRATFTAERESRLRPGFGIGRPATGRYRRMRCHENEQPAARDSDGSGRGFRQSDMGLSQGLSIAARNRIEYPFRGSDTCYDGMSRTQAAGTV